MELVVPASVQAALTNGQIGPKQLIGTSVAKSANNDSGLVALTPAQVLERYKGQAAQQPAEQKPAGGVGPAYWGDQLPDRKPIVIAVAVLMAMVAVFYVFRFLK